MRSIRLFIIKCIVVMPLLTSSVESAPDKLFIDIVNYSASIDGYSSLCVKVLKNQH